MLSTPIDVSVILVSWNTCDLLIACIRSLQASLDGVSADVWVVDNDSSDGSVEAVRAQFPTVNVIVNKQNCGFAAANNQALRISSGRYALLLNSDTIATPGAIGRLVRFADSVPRAGLVGGLLLNPDGSFQYSFSDFPSLTSELLSATGLGERFIFRGFPSYAPDQSCNVRSVDVIPGACMLVRRSALLQVGCMDEGYFMYSEEPDWCMRMRQAGWETWYLPEARIFHYGGQSTRQIRRAMVQALYRSKVRYFRKHHGPISAFILQLLIIVVRRLHWLVNLPKAWRRGDVEPALRWEELCSTGLNS